MFDPDKPFFTGRVSEQLLQSYSAGPPPKGESTLTARERTIVRLMAEGQSSRTIGEILNLSVKTIQSHWATAMRKLKLSSIAAVVRYVIRSKLIQP